MALRTLFLAAVIAGGGLRAQSVRIYTELQRVDPFCAVVAADKAGRSREVLSPALARNGYATFQAVISVPEGQQYSLFLGQNPEGAVKVAAYRPVWVKRDNSYIPDGLEPLTITDNGEIVDDAAEQVEGQTCRVVWLDLWVPPESPVRRTRFEVQLNVAGHWVIYPMELRISSAIAPPAAKGPFEPLPPPEAPASATAARVLHAYLCGTQGGESEEGPLTVRRLIRRNARQDVAIARLLENRAGKTALAAELLEKAGVADRTKWCESPPGHGNSGGEWYLRVRDFLLHSKLLGPAEVAMPRVAIKPGE
ncbi:MAG TPA: hypothetical protein PLA43_07500 [Bryobacteraceae bacterium]|nr:hypothetical protein [Bryobacteraceae bacterium]HOQ43771.1 hypothetical protein [Bryobacteraceae bacterium]HPU71786.1 hypothetical protein [Bryobacteraceae bacterium]